MKKLFFALLLACSTQLQAQTVIGIHGFLSTYRSMAPIKRALNRACIPNLMWRYQSRDFTLEEQACQLIPVLQQIACEHPGEPIDFVTHSIGALVLRAALNHSDCPEEARSGRAVLIAPPNKGSSLGRRWSNVGFIQFVFGDKSGKELLCYNECDILQLGAFPASMEVLVLSGTRGNPWMFTRPNDGFLTLNETALETPFYWQAFPTNHGGLLINSDSLSATVNFLRY